MTQDEIIKMARQAGFDCYREEITWDDVNCTEELVAFAKLVAQRTWVDLTDEQMLECNIANDFMVDREIAKLNVQAKLKDMNT